MADPRGRTAGLYTVAENHGSAERQALGDAVTPLVAIAPALVDVAIGGLHGYNSQNGVPMANVSRGRILCVDADSAELGAHARALGRAGFEVKAAPANAHARSLFETERFDAVLSDVSALQTDPWALVRTIRQFDKDVPVILMTDAERKVARPAVEYGAVECLSKPVALTVLERTLERVVGMVRRWRSVAAYRNRRGEEVEIASFTATDAKNEFGRVLQKAAHGIVVITRHDEPQAVVLSFDEFKDLAGARDGKLEALSSEFNALLAKMQTPEARRGMKAAFDATAARMGKAAVAAARKRG